MKCVSFPTGVSVPAFGMGTWHMGDHAAHRDEEVATLRLGLELGATLIDTAEMYGNGRSEQLVGEAMAGRRDDVFLVSKVLPQNATEPGTIAACERSLQRLRTDRIDLYLLHWRGEVALAETLRGFVRLREAGKIRFYGVSNLDEEDLQEFWEAPGGEHMAVDQLLYNLSRRALEWKVLPWLRERRIPLMAYSPIEQARLLESAPLREFARRHSLTPAQAALGWLLAKDDVVVIPKTSRRERLRENWGALEHPLTRSQVAELDQLFPRPAEPGPLEML